MRQGGAVKDSVSGHHLGAGDGAVIQRWQRLTHRPSTSTHSSSAVCVTQTVPRGIYCTRVSNILTRVTLTLVFDDPPPPVDRTPGTHQTPCHGHHQAGCQHSQHAAQHQRYPEQGQDHQLVCH